VSFKRIADLATGFGFQWHGRSALRKDIYAVQQVPIAVVVCRQVRHIGKIDLKQVVDAFRVGPSSRKTTTIGLCMVYASGPARYLITSLRGFPVCLRNFSTPPKLPGARGFV